ncbi:uncharacterized protein BDV17DRAFT_99810 [Aspergillus undulatus]|uniref:uncharacterized protein n=1 Tax=Aspergillus undulatus TaxID=1810928 RepID=UPI003CCE0112
MKPYPGQINSSVPFISDIASFELKPLFLVWASLTAAGFVLTVAAVHVVRFEPGFALVEDENHQSEGAGDGRVEDGEGDGNGDEDEGNENENDSTLNPLRLISLTSISSAFSASLSLTLLAVMDTFQYSIAHDICLRLCFAGLAVQALGAAIVYGDERFQAVLVFAFSGTTMDGVWV